MGIMGGLEGFWLKNSKLKNHIGTRGKKTKHVTTVVENKNKLNVMDS